ncbi:MAG: amidohydrolase [Pirellulales bacterium]|nr:amidohydrolase [Pirellulales bacterium]
MKYCIAQAIVLFGLSIIRVCAQTNSLQDIAKEVVPPPFEGTTIYVSREFITMDPQKPKAEAVAIKQGKFTAVGSLTEVQAAVEKDAKVDRSFADKVVTAGFVEQHVHPVLAALTMATIVISIEDWETISGFSPAVRDPVEYRRRLQLALKNHRESGDLSQPFISWGYHHYMHGEISRKLLSELAPDFPVIIWHRSCHEFYFNDAALRLAGIDELYYNGMPNSAKEQSNLERGHFFEQGALAILSKIAPILASKDQFMKGLQFTVEYYHRNGITTCCEPGGFPSKPIQDLINSVYSAPTTPFNHYFMADGKSLAAANPGQPLTMLAESEKVLDWGNGRARYLPKQVKLLTDGAIFSQLMMMTDQYTDGHKGAWIMDPPVFSYAFQNYWDAGYQIHVHNNGDAGLDVLIGELAKAMERHPRSDHRTVLVHFGFARPEQVEKWIRLGGIVSSNPYYVTALAGRYGKLGMTEQWAQNMVPHAYVRRHKGSLSFHSDMPMAPAKPLQLIWAASNRLTYEQNVAGPEHRVPVAEALRAITIDAAYSIQLDKEIGSIEVGKNANLTILNQNPLDVKPESIHEIRVWGTMLEGRVQPVKSSEHFNAASPNQGAIKRVNDETISKHPAADDQTQVALQLELQNVRRQNSLYWESLQRRETAGGKNTLEKRINLNSGYTSCQPGCSCTLSRQFGGLIEFHLTR